jgi:hypothetical protein
MGAPNLYGCIADSVDCKTPLPEDEAAKKEYWNVVRASLGEQQYAVVAMYFRESLTQEDIAERLHKSQEAVGKVLRKSLARLASPPVRSKLERAIPAARKPPVAGHRALHAYQVAYAQGETAEEKEFDREQADEVAADERRKEHFGEAWDEYVHGD